ncbi:MAG: RNA polymerase sigma factor [Myxococcota bacterium]
MGQELSDEALMNRYLEGDANAFQELVRRHGQKVYNFILRHTGDRPLAEDLVQDTFLRVVHRADTFRRQARFTTWLYTIARNLCIDHARKAKHRRHLALDAPLRRDEQGGATLLDRVEAPDPLPDSRTRDRRFREALRAALDALPGEQREVFIMREYDGLKFREIAEVVGVPENTIKSRMRYALQGLRAALAEFQETIR